MPTPDPAVLGRRIEIVGGRIRISDTFTNLRDEITGVTIMKMDAGLKL